MLPANALLRQVDCHELPLVQVADHPASASLLVGNGLAASLQVSGLPPTVWVCSGAPLRLAVPEYEIVLEPGDVLVTEDGLSVSARLSHPNGSWIALGLPPAVLAPYLRELAVFRGDDVPVFRTLATGDDVVPGLLRRLAGLDAVARTRPGVVEDAVLAVVKDVVRRQRTLHDLLGRCPGRTLTHRRRTLQGLQRSIVLAASVNRDLRIDQLAAAARISPWHFIKTFRRVFGTSPHPFFMGLRLRKAWALLAGHGLSVADTMRALGFSNRCAFSRVFRQHFGVPPSRVAQLHRAGPALAPNRPADVRTPPETATPRATTRPGALELRN